VGEGSEIEGESRDCVVTRPTLCYRKLMCPRIQRKVIEDEEDEQEWRRMWRIV